VSEEEQAAPRAGRVLAQQAQNEQVLAQQARTSREMSPGMSSVLASSDPGDGKAAGGEQD
jgi:hypothetical protein